MLLIIFPSKLENMPDYTESKIKELQHVEKKLVKLLELAGESINMLGDSCVPTQEKPSPGLFDTQVVEYSKLVGDIHVSLIKLLRENRLRGIRCSDSVSNMRTNVNGEEIDFSIMVDSAKAVQQHINVILSITNEVVPNKEVDEKMLSTENFQSEEPVETGNQVDTEMSDSFSPFNIAKDEKLT